MIEIMRPITVLDSLPVYFMSMERAIYEMRDAFLEYASDGDSDPDRRGGCC